MWVWLLVIVGLLLILAFWPGRPQRWPVLLITDENPEQVEGVLRWLSANGRVVAVVGPDGGEVEEIVTRLQHQANGVLGLWSCVEQAMDAADAAAAVVLRLNSRLSVQELLRQV